MSPHLDDTHDPALQSWVESANDPDTEFPIQNLPLGRFRRDGAWRLGAAIGDRVLDLQVAGLVELADMNRLMAQGPQAATELRRRLSAGLRAGAVQREAWQTCLVGQSAVEMGVPCEIGDYTDFYTGIHHATTVGRLFRPDNPLLPNYKWVPIGYHGRASSIVPSGTAVRRPNGQTRDDASAPPTFGPSKRLDYEMELGMVIGSGNALGEPVPIGQALDHVFGFCIVNDWSARDIQTWEYQPLGPFLAKNFATSISPWIVTLDALEPFRTTAFRRAEGDPEPLPYLEDDTGFDIHVEVWLRTAKMTEPVRLSRGNFRDMYWTVAQLVAHHTSNGCNLLPGDLLASGTISGTSKDSRGSLLELAWRGTEPIELPTGETRRFLEDGDEVILRAYCEREGVPRIGFGECRGVVLAAV